MASGQVDVNWAKQHHSPGAEHELGKAEEAVVAEANSIGMTAAE